MVTGSLIRQHHLGLLRGSGRNPCAVGLGFSPSAAGGCISKQEVVWPEGRDHGGRLALRPEVPRPLSLRDYVCDAELE